MARPASPSAAAAFALVVAAAACVWGCAAERPVLTDEQFAAVAAVDEAQTRQTSADAVGRLLERVERRAADEPRPTLHILALSGGGEYGAFGAGFLRGWGTVPDPQRRRPEFDLVTGVSTGALLAPFAFIGTEAALAEVEGFYKDPAPDWIRPRGLLYFLPYKPSFRTIPGLERDIRAVVDAELIDALARRSREGAVLIVTATDLDLGRQKFWNLGAEAERARATGDEDRIERVLMASSAVPAVFPPVEIDRAVYADGGVTANVFLRLDPRNPDGFIARWLAANPGRPLPRVRYWVIINNQLEHPPETVQVRWPAVVAPSLQTAIRSATVAEVRWLAAQADYVNAAYDADIEVRVAAIPDWWRPPVEGEFQPQTMTSLADLGRRMGADPGAWMVWSAPELARPRAPPAGQPRGL